MPELNEIFGGGEYLKAADLSDGDVLLTIHGVDIKEFEEDGKVKRKPILSFEGTDKKLVCNITNSRVIGEVYGTNTDSWPGKQISLYSTRVDFAGKLVDAIRIRIPKKGGGKKPDWHKTIEDAPDDPMPF